MPQYQLKTLTVDYLISLALFAASGGLLVVIAEAYRRVLRRFRDSEARLQIAIDAADLSVWDLDLLSDTASSRSLRHDQIFGYTEQQAEWGQAIAEDHRVVLVKAEQQRLAIIDFFFYVVVDQSLAPMAAAATSW